MISWMWLLVPSAIIVILLLVGNSFFKSPYIKGWLDGYSYRGARDRELWLQYLSEESDDEDKEMPEIDELPRVRRRKE